MRELTPEQRRDELAMMQQKRYGGWPCWPLLPIKKSNPEGGWPKFGALLDSGPLGKGVEVKPIVYDHSIFGPESLDQTKIVAEYASLEALVDDGWRVD